MSAVPQVRPAADLSGYRASFEAFRQALPQNEPAWLRALRARAFRRFEELGFPGPRDEDWRHTSVAPIARTAFRLPEATEAGALTTGALADLPFGRVLDVHRIVLVNGRYAPELSSEKGRHGVVVESLREVLDGQPQLVEPYLARQDDPRSAFTALSTAFLRDGAFVSIPEGTVLRDPIHVVVYSARGASPEPTMSHPRVLVLAGRRSQAVVVETYEGRPGDTYFTNAVTEVVAEDDAVLEHSRLQHESERAFHIGTLALRQGRATSVTSHAMMLGGALSRLDVRQVFEGEGGECVLDGLFMASGTQHTDIHTFVDHAQPHGTTRELYKGVVDGKGRGVFVGRILVRPGARKTDAVQTNKNLLLSKEALVDSLPQLEILNDDVKCKHGSTTGQIDPLALFYLRSRGIDEPAARSLLTYAFATEVVNRLGVEALRRDLARYLQERLPGAGEVREASA